MANIVTPKANLIVTTLLMGLLTSLCLGPAASAAESVSNEIDPDSDSQRAAVEQLLKAAEDEYGKDSPELLSRLINLASIEIKSADWDSAITSTSRALDILGRAPDKKSEILVLVLRSHAAGGAEDYKSAKADVQNALKINKKLKPVDRHQEAMLYGRLLDIAVSQRSLQDGNRWASKMLKTDQKHFAKGDAGYIPTLIRAANWYRLSKQLNQERKLVWQSIDIMEAAYGEKDGRLAEPLHRIAQSYIVSHEPADEAKMALNRAMELEFATPRETAVNKASTRAKLADYTVVFGNPETATPLYEEAWQLITDEPSMGADMANQTFASEGRLYFREPDKPGTSRGRSVLVEGFVQVEFTVTAQGTVEDIIIVDSEPKELKEKKYIQAYGKARYRPRVIDGKVTATPNIQHRSTTWYEK